jgi:hypothetical protein
MTPVLRRVVPSPTTDTTITEAYTVERRAPTGRPWVALTMIASLDGAVAVGGTSGALGNANDRQLLLTMRDLADARGMGRPERQGSGSASSPTRATSTSQDRCSPPVPAS